MMIRKIALGAAATLLVVGLPVAALGLSRTDDVSSPTVAQDEAAMAIPASSADAIATTAGSQAQAQQQLRIHAETGIPDGVTPTQTRQRLHDQTATQNSGNPQAQGKQHGGNSGTRGTQPADGTGNQHGRNGGGQGGNAGGGAGQGHGGNGTDTPGECTNPDGPVGTGPNGTSG